MSLRFERKVIRRGQNASLLSLVVVILDYYFFSIWCLIFCLFIRCICSLVSKARMYGPHTYPRWDSWVNLTCLWIFKESCQQKSLTLDQFSRLILFFTILDVYIKNVGTGPMMQLTRHVFLTNLGPFWPNLRVKSIEEKILSFMGKSARVIKQQKRGVRWNESKCTIFFGPYMICDEALRYEKHLLLD